MSRWLCAILGFCVSVTVSAASYNSDTDPFEVSLPNFDRGFEISISVPYMRPSYYNTDVLVYENKTTSPAATDYPFGQSDGFCLDRDFARALMVGWRFGNTAVDARFYYFSMDTSEGFNANVGNRNEAFFWIAVGNAEDGDSLYFKKANRTDAAMDFKVETFDFEVAQHVNIGCRGKLRLMAGISLDDVSVDSRVGYAGLDLPETYIVAQKSSFDGVGPYIGLDGSFNVGWNIGLIAHLRTALIVGDLNSQIDTDLFPPSEVDVNYLDFEHVDRCVVVPVIEARLGADVSYCVHRLGELRLEGGYWVRHYVDAVNQLQISTVNNVTNYINNINSVSFSGYYLTFHLLITPLTLWS